MIGDAAEAGAMADRLLAEGIYVRAFSFPVVPRGKARIRTQMSAAHSRDDLDRAIAAFEKVRAELNRSEAITSWEKTPPMASCHPRGGRQWAKSRHR